MLPCRAHKKKGGGDLLSRLVDSTIGAAGLNCSVRDGKRWDPRAVTALNKATELITTQSKKTEQEKRLKNYKIQAFGQLVALGFAVTDFTPVPYLRPSLERPS